MRTDRELLELAAKAAGVVGDWCESYECILLTDTETNEGCDTWAPFIDDGDALQLAVLLRLDILQDENSVSVKRYVGPATEAEYLAQERILCSRLDTTRRAIVRAAAEIGAAM